MTSSFRLLSTGLALSLLMAGAAQAQGQMPPKAEYHGQMGHVGQGADHPVGSGLNVFFSPSGQPFRGQPGDPYPIAAWFAQADTDKDGKISYDEYMADAKRFFNLLDVNHDGFVSSPENSNYENKVAPEILRIDPRIDQPPRYHVDDSDVVTDNDPRLRNYVKTVQGASQFSVLDEPQPVRAADKNFDFRISGDEWVNASEARFKTLDRNDDGFLTQDELPQTPAQQAIAAEAKKKVKDDKGGKKKSFGIW
ncbi:MAG TPA: EF-hand domain-containing protein [Asticcacaulis sp.]|nr:EF-hand domain-containing protein [Asticcacaulis sp.]